MFKPLAALAMTLALAACATVPTTPSAPPAPLKIASWNIEFLAEQNGKGCNPRTEADYAKMKMYADRLGADVIAFEEVESVAAAARVFDPKRYDIIIENRPGDSKPSACGGSTSQMFIRQAVGFAIRKDLAYERLPDLTALQVGNPNLRSGVDIIVRPKTGTPIRLLAVHLKSGCFSGLNGEACATLQRQAPVLEHWIDARAGEGLRFAVLGDFNRRLALPDDAIWKDLDDGEPANADLSLAEGVQRPHCDPRFKDFIDHVILDKRAKASLAGFEEQTYDPADGHPSDHCPISVRLN